MKQKWFFGDISAVDAENTLRETSNFATG